MKNFQIIWLNPQIARTPDSHTRGGMGARRAALLAGVLIAHCTAVGRAGTPNAWSAVDLSGDVPGRLRGHGTAEAGGLLYVFGGNSNDIGRNNRLTEIDPATGVCTRLDAGAGVTGAPPAAREDFGFAALDGVLWVFGGYVGDRHAEARRSNDLYAYTIAVRAWRQLDAAAGDTGEPPARSRMGFSAGAGGLLLTFGFPNARDAHFFDVASQVWRALPAPPAPDRQAHAQAVLNGSIFVFGGMGEGAGTAGGTRNDLLALKLGDAAAQWTVVAVQGDVPTNRSGSVLVSFGQQLLLYGGYSSDSVGDSSTARTTYHNDTALFDPRTGSWTAVTGAAGTWAGRDAFGGAAVIGCSVYLYGGNTASGRSNKLIRYEADAAGGRALHACTCAPGQTGPSGNTCKPCDKGKFKGASGTHPCTVAPQCPANSVSATTSNGSSAACWCNAGYSGPVDGGACQACAAGSHKSWVGGGLCINCDDGKSSPAGSDAGSDCINCAAGKFAVAGGICTNCAAGKSSSAGSDADSDCTDCAAGKFAAAAGGVCTNCAAGKYALSTAAQSCSDCVAGTFSPTVGASSPAACQSCAAGKFSVIVAANNSEVCDGCPPNAISAIGSASRASCTCKPGFSGPNGGTCKACAAGSFKPFMGDAACSDCSAGKSSPAGSDAGSDCTNCAAGKFSAAGGICTNCAAGKSSSAGSDADSDCTDCAAGKFATSGGVCTNCAAGKWCADDRIEPVDENAGEESVAPAATEHFVTLTVTMPYTKADFNTDVQKQYKNAVASAAGTTVLNVDILSITESRRRAGSVVVETKIRAVDAASASSIRSRLGSGDTIEATLNASLKSQGLREAVHVSLSTTSSNMPLVIGGAAGGGAAFLLLLSVCIWLQRRHTRGFCPPAEASATFADIHEPSPAGVSTAQARAGLGSTARALLMSPQPTPNSDMRHVIGGVCRDTPVLARNKKWEEAQEGRDLQRDAMNSKCVLCRENEPTMAFMPCGHRGVCERCDDFISFNGGSALSTCPMCGQDVKEMKRIFVN